MPVATARILLYTAHMQDALKKIWLRSEIAVADELMALAPRLRDEFLARHDDFISGSFSRGVPIELPTLPDPSALTTRMEAWKMDGLQYRWQDANILKERYKEPKIQRRYPTACALLERLGDHCGCAGYSVLERQAVITRHTGVENRDNEYLRIHVPLIVPPGDIFFEVEGTEIDWSDIWGFDNQLVHSAHNLTDHRRLVFLIDLRRDYLGLPDQPPFDPHRESTIPPFRRGALPRQLHEHQRQAQQRLLSTVILD